MKSEIKDLVKKAVYGPKYPYNKTGSFFIGLASFLVNLLNPTKK